MNTNSAPDLILRNGRITTLDPAHREATSLVIKDGRIVAVDDETSYERGPNTKVIDLKGRRAIPGLNDSHLHVIRGGLNYNLELRWDGVPSLIQRVGQGNPTGMLIARPNATILYATLAKGRAILRFVLDRKADPSAVIMDSRTLQSTPESGARSPPHCASRD